MTDLDQSCSSAWREYSGDSVRFCGRAQNASASCSSVNYSPDGMEYKEVCGRIIGHQFATPHGLDTSILFTPGSEID